MLHVRYPHPHIRIIRIPRPGITGQNATVVTLLHQYTSQTDHCVTFFQMKRLYGYLRAWELITVIISVVRYPRYLDTYRRFLRDDTSIAKVTIYRGIS